MKFTTKKELDAFKKKHRSKLLKLEKKINWEEVQKYNDLLREKKILDATFSVGDLIQWFENESDGCNGTCRATYSGEITEINLDIQRYEVKMKSGEMVSVDYSPYAEGKYGVRRIDPSQGE